MTVPGDGVCSSTQQSIVFGVKGWGSRAHSAGVPVGNNSGISLGEGLGSLWTPCLVTTLSFLPSFLLSLRHE